MTSLRKFNTQKTLSLNENGYDLLRLVLAAMVVFTHCYAVGGFGPTEPLKTFSKEGVLLADLGVLGFFGLSGFLISASFGRSNSVWSYFSKRIRRIFPGYWVCLVLTAFLFAPAIWQVSGHALSSFPWLSSGGALNYVTANFFLIIGQQTIGTVLAVAVWPGSINGSLGTLFPEFLCYIAVALLGLGGALSGSRWLLVGTALVTLIYHVVTCIYGRGAFPHVPTFFAFTKYAPYFAAFAVGACASIWRERLKYSWASVAILIILSTFLLKFGGFKIAAPILTTCLVLMIGGCFVVRLRTDLSYGIYIYSFPCQQFLYACDFAEAGLPAYFILSLLASAGCAWLSWKCIECPALHRA